MESSNFAIVPTDCLAGNRVRSNAKFPSIFEQVQVGPRLSRAQGLARQSPRHPVCVL